MATELEAIEAGLAGDGAAGRAFFEAERELARGVLARGDARDVPGLVLDACARLEPAADLLAKGAPPACARGCSWCCRGVKVEATVPEVLAIAESFRAGRCSEDVAALARDATERARALRDLDAETRWARKTPCRFLDEASGACTIYAVRPLACRAHASFDATACEDAAADPSAEAPIPRHMVPAHVFGTLKMALVAAVEDAGLDARNFELANAVAVAMNEPNATLRWLRGERLFDQASIPSDERDRVRALRALAKQGLVPPERLLDSARTRPEKNAAKRERRARRGKGR
jgi:Fe-S-cluster containining protein